MSTPSNRSVRTLNNLLHFMWKNNLLKSHTIPGTDKTFMEQMVHQAFGTQEQELAAIKTAIDKEYADGKSVKSDDMLDNMAEWVRHHAEIEQELKYISENICGVKVEGDVTLDMVYAFVEGEIERQSDLKGKAQADVTRLTAELEAVKNQGEQYRLETHRWSENTREMKCELEDLRAKRALIRAGLERWSEFYGIELAQAEKLIKSCEQSGDTHGVNFHQGKRGALVSTDIALKKLKDSVKQAVL